VAVKYINDKTILTLREAREKYEKFYIGFVDTEPLYHDPDNTKGYVVCVMDDYDEGYTFPRETDDGSFIGIMSGYAVGGTEIGGICID
jgi:hypothetical protein